MHCRPLFGSFGCFESCLEKDLYFQILYKIVLDYADARIGDYCIPRPVLPRY